MIIHGIVTENELDTWVRGHSRDAQGVIGELVLRLIAASVQRPKVRRFPRADSIGQHGPDGHLDTELAFDPFVPEGESFWEFGVGAHASRKATEDYKDKTAATPLAVRTRSTFVFVSPLSAARDWDYSWKDADQAAWVEERRARSDWRNVRVYDATILVDWMHTFPAVELWMANVMGIQTQQLETPELLWTVLRAIGDPPPLIPDVFTTGREDALERVRGLFDGAAMQLQLDTRFPDQVPTFIAACVATMAADEMLEAAGRCLMVSGVAGWNSAVALREPHVLVAMFTIDDSDTAGSVMLQKARMARHAVIYAGQQGGVPHPNRIGLRNPNQHQINTALVKAGYKAERARSLASKCDGNVGYLLRCLQNLSLMAEWSQDSTAADLAVAQLMASWRDDVEADRAIAEQLSGNSYGEWIETMRRITLRPGTPLTQQDGAWRFVSRYEGWHALGPRLFDDHLDRFRVSATSVLKERDPQFDLEPSERYAAAVHGKRLLHSNILRRGVADTLALLGSFPKALTSCTVGKPETTANLIVRDVLSVIAWDMWASLDPVLPLLAEAAPSEFLTAVEKGLDAQPCPFDRLFEQEGVGLTGGNYMTGLLWALETLAWSEDFISRVVHILATLAHKDPGGSWGNRPANSLAVIYLPWLPQTCAPLRKRLSVLTATTREFPDVGWKLLLSLLPCMHQVSEYSRKPAWRELIPGDWTDGVTEAEYREQVEAYADLAVATAVSDHNRLKDLVERLADLPPRHSETLLTHLRSDVVYALPDLDKYEMWGELMNFVATHTKFADARWAASPDLVSQARAVATLLEPASPLLRHKRIFTDSDRNLIELDGSYEAQQLELKFRRQAAVRELFETSGISGLLEFTSLVESPWRVGFAFGTIATVDCDDAILPDLIESPERPVVLFAGGYVLGRFNSAKWEWVDVTVMASWQPAQKGQFLAYLPFVRAAWDRVTRVLQDDEAPYWVRANANPYEEEDNLEYAIDRLIRYDRPLSALFCMDRLIQKGTAIKTHLAIRALDAALNTQEPTNATAQHAIIDVIKTLQDDAQTDREALARIEWQYLPLLTELSGATPRTLGQRMADNPGFFCDVIRLVFRSRIEDKRDDTEPTADQHKLAVNAYELLNRWRIVPGSSSVGAFNGEDLSGWIGAVKSACRESGHLEVALTMVGQALIYTPPDPRGLWIHQAAAMELNASDAAEMREGFRIGLVNSRGVHGWSAGAEETAYSAEYRTKASDLESYGYIRIAATLRELAEYYARDAQREASHDPLDDG